MEEYMIVMRLDGKLVHLKNTRTSALVDRKMYGRWKSCLLVTANSYDEAVDKFIERYEKEQSHGS